MKSLDKILAINKGRSSFQKIGFLYLLVLILVSLFLISRGYGLHPIVFADEYVYNKNARLVPFDHFFCFWVFAFVLIRSNSESRVWEYLQLAGSVSRTDEGNPPMEVGEELAAVQVSPDLFLRILKGLRFGVRFRGSKQNLRRLRHHDIHPLFRRIHRDRFNAPGGSNPHQILIQLRVSQRSSLFQKIHRGYR